MKKPEKYVTNDTLTTWDSSSQQVMLTEPRQTNTCTQRNINSIPKDIFLLPDILTARNNVTQRLSSSPPPGDQKEKLASFNSNGGSDASKNRNEVQHNLQISARD
jgi:hypothetical protein